MVLNINKELQKEVIDDFIKFLEKKIKQKGRFSFNSPWEIMGKMGIEELHELTLDLHKKDWKGFENELMDIAVCAIWGIASLRVNNNNAK